MIIIFSKCCCNLGMKLHKIEYSCHLLTKDAFADNLVPFLLNVGSKYQSSLNEIDKSEHKSSVDSTKGLRTQKIDTISSNGRK